MPIIDLEGAAPNQNNPIVYLDVSKADLGELAGLEPGAAVKIVLIGKVVSVAKRQDDQGKTGTISLEYKDLEVMDAPSMEMEALMGDDE